MIRWLVKEDENVKTAQVNELCVKIDELNIKWKIEQKSKEELQKHYQKVNGCTVYLRL